MKYALIVLIVFLAGCADEPSASSQIEKAMVALEKETGNPEITISNSYFGQNKGGLTALCGTATGLRGETNKFSVLFANGGEVASVGEGATWSVFCGDDAKARFREDHPS